jgi:hypothetical protein
VGVRDGGHASKAIVLCFARVDLSAVVLDGGLGALELGGVKVDGVFCGATEYTEERTKADLRAFRRDAPAFEVTTGGKGVTGMLC